MDPRRYYYWFLEREAKVKVKNGRVQVKGNSKGRYVLCPWWCRLIIEEEELRPLVVRYDNR